VELQTRHGHPSVGTPIEVPEPRTVTLSGVRGILNEPNKPVRVAERGRVREALNASWLWPAP